MNQIEILIQALRISSDTDREAFLIRECQEDPGKLVELRQLLSREKGLQDSVANLNDLELRQFVESLISAGGTSAGSFPADGNEHEDSAWPDTRDSGSPVPQSVVRETEDLPSTGTKGLEIAGRYVLSQPIGEGGMGEVWIAQQYKPVKTEGCTQAD